MKTKINSELDFPYEVIRTNRKKSASIKVLHGKVQFIIPKHLSQKRLELLIQKKTPWVIKKLHDLSQVEPVKPKEYVNGECFTYLGRNYRLRLDNKESNKLKLTGGKFVLGDENTEFVRNSLIEWYLYHAKERLEEKTYRYAKLIGVNPKSVKVKSYKSRWGSCSVHGDITYNWKIIIAPHRIVDYVVVHELCHLLHHNHSGKFWKSVECVIPEWNECRTWLRDFGNTLVV